MDDSSEIMVEWNGNRFRMADNPRDGKFTMVGIKEDIPHYIAKLQEIAPQPNKGVQSVSRRDVYVPRNREVLAVQWDGEEEAFDKISVLSQLVGHSCRHIREGKLNISKPTEQRSDMHVEHGSWILFGPPHGIDIIGTEEFESQYMKVR